MDDVREAAVAEFRLDGPACVVYRPRLVAFYRSLDVESEFDCEDLTHTVLTKVLPRERCFPSEKARDTYVFKAAANVWKDWIGKQQRTRTVSLDEMSEPDGDGVTKLPRALVEAPEALNDALDGERLALLSAEVEKLPPKMRRCVYLFYTKSRSLKEIAQLQRIDVNTVKSHLGQAREILGKRLGGKFGIIPQA